MTRFLDPIWRFALSLGLLAVAISCSPQPPAVSTPTLLPQAAPSSPLAVPTSAPLTSVPTVPANSALDATATSAVSQAPSTFATATPGGSPQNPPAPSVTTITLADSGKSIAMQPNQRIELVLGSEYDWQIKSDNTAVLSLVPNSTGQNTQGDFQANKAGQASLSGTGNPKCLNSVPRCLLPSRLFQLHVTVGAAAPAAPTSASAPSNITLADNGKTVTLHTGDRVTLQLGTDYTWDEPVSTNPNVLSRVIGILVVRGAQGVYEAKAPGTSSLETNGRVVCPAGQMCPQVMLHFAVQVNVQ